MNKPSKKNKKNKKFVVDVFRIYARSVEIEAKNEKEAEEIAYNMTFKGDIDPRSFEMTEDIETKCSGIVDKNGERHYN